MSHPSNFEALFTMSTVCLFLLTVAIGGVWLLHRAIFKDQD